MSENNKTGKILLVGQNRILAQKIEDYLRVSCWIFTGCAESGKVALNKIREEKPDIVLLDIHLKGEINGLETAKLIHQHSGPPVIIYGPSKDYETIYQALEYQPEAVILEPFNQAKLLLTLRLFAVKQDKELQTRNFIRHLTAKINNLPDAVMADSMDSIVAADNTTDRLQHETNLNVIESSKNLVLEQSKKQEWTAKELAHTVATAGVQQPKCHTHKFDGQTNDPSVQYGVTPFDPDPDKKKFKIAFQSVHEPLSLPNEPNSPAQLYGSVFEQMSDAVMISQSRIITYINPVFTKLFGLAESDMIGKHFSVPFVPDCHELLEQIVGMHLAQIDIPFSLEVEICGKTKNTQVEISTSPILLYGQMAQIWILHDKSKQGTRERTERSSARSSYAFFQGMFITNMNQEITYIDKMARAIWCIDDAKEFSGKPLSHLFVQAEKNKQMELAIKEKGEWSGELFGIKKNDRRIRLRVQVQTFADLSRSPICLIWSVTPEPLTSQYLLESKLVPGYGGLVGGNAKMIDLYENIKLAAMADIPVFLEGETGTGKELVAAAIHKTGLRADKPFVAINCGALTESIVESELFGHEKGSFTGAHKNRLGKIQAAHNGTLFLDEVCELSLAIQVKLLRVLQENYLERVGGNESIPINVRIICATNKNVEEEIKAGRFREDLFYRICVLHLSIPPLRERQDDLDLLISHFLNTSKYISAGQKVPLSQESRQALHDYNWPGNIRELKNVIQLAVLKCQGNMIELQHLPERFLKENQPPVEDEPIRPQRKKKLRPSTVQETLRQTNGNKQKTARLLGVSRATLYRFLEQPV